MKTDFALGRFNEAKERGRLLVKNNTLLSESFMVMGDIFIERGILMLHLECIYDLVN